MTVEAKAGAQSFRIGLDIPRVALMTGHKTWAQLRRYTAITPGDVHAALAKATGSRVVPLRTRNRAAR